MCIKYLGSNFQKVVWVDPKGVKHEVNRLAIHSQFTVVASLLATNNSTKLELDIRLADTLMHQSIKFVFSQTRPCKDFKQKLVEVVNYSSASFEEQSVKVGSQDFQIVTDCFTFRIEMR